MFEFLNRPYPFSFQPSRRIKQIIPIVLCVFSFLVLFKPFGLGNNPDYILFSAFMSTSGGFAGLTTTVLIPLMFPRYFNEAIWTLKRNLVWTFWIHCIFVSIMFSALNIFLISKYNVYTELTFRKYLWWVYIQLLIGVPLGIIVNLVNQYYLLKKYLKIADNINHSMRIDEKLISGTLLEFEVDNLKTEKVEVEKLIYVEALGNYINIVYICDTNRKITIRDTITNIEQRIGNSEIIYKPHRSYLVNLKNIGSITGDSQGLKIHLKDSDKIIPVSRNKIKEFKKLVADIV